VWSGNNVKIEREEDGKQPSPANKDCFIRLGFELGSLVIHTDTA